VRVEEDMVAPVNYLHYHHGNDVVGFCQMSSGITG
jgi:hypothetical protein